MRTAKLLVALLSVVALSNGVAGCGDGAAHETAVPNATAGGAAPGSRLDIEGDVTVSAAKSLSGAFTEIGADFTVANPDVEVTFNFDSSSTLSAQIVEGAPADVYASADVANMARLTDASLVADEPEIFARNELVIVTKPGNPEGIGTLADLAGAGVISLCGEGVPCGRYAATALDAAGVTIDESSITRGQNVGATLTAVAEGDAVAGIVYMTEAQSAGDAVEVVTIPADANPVVTYPIGVLAAAADAEAAEAFVAYVLSDEGRATLTRYGFLPPS